MSGLFERVNRKALEGNNDICITRPRRFGIPVSAEIKEYAATSMNLQTKDELFSAMVVYGFLSYEDQKVSIPNKELMDKFADMLKKEPALGYVHRLARESTIVFHL